LERACVEVFETSMLIEIISFKVDKRDRKWRKFYKKAVRIFIFFSVLEWIK
jgi:hypothetical protein